MRFAVAYFSIWLCTAATLSAQTPAPATTVKIIEWGWDEPNTDFLRQHAAEMQQYPFDGVVFHLTTSGNFTWEVWGSCRFERSEFAADLENLKSAKLGRLTENFIRVNVTPGNVGWFDDETWKTIVNNCGLVAEVAQSTGCRGILLDTEQYQGELFRYQPDSGQTLAETRLKARQRGSEWVQAVNKYDPDVVLFLSFGYRTAQPKPGQSPDTQRYTLLPDFLDGILQACSAETTLIDGWEQSYGYRRTEQFAAARQTMLHQALEWTAFPEKYKQHLQPSFGLWMDFNLEEHGWHENDFSRNYFTPEQFAASLQSAIAHSDRYVWIYTEQPRWWTAEKLPAAYVEAVRQSRPQ